MKIYINLLEDESGLERHNSGFVTSTGGKPLAILRDDYLSQGWIEINDPDQRDLLLETYFDRIDSKIIKACTNVPRNIMDIIRLSGLPQTTAYRRILDLIKNQFLVSFDKVSTDREHAIPRYIAKFKDFQILINNFDDAQVKVVFNHPS